MPFAAFLPLISQGVSTIGNMISGGIQNRRNIAFQREANAQNIAFQREANNQNFAFQREMYDRTRQDALADFNMQNQYNSPAAQMQRFKDAGLSPHLIYGQTNTAQAVRTGTLGSPSAKAPNVTAPQVDNRLLSQGLSLEPYFNAMAQQVSIDNTKAATDKLKVDSILSQMKSLTEVYNAMGKKNTALKISLEHEILANSKLMKAEREGLINSKMKSDIQFTDDENKRKEAKLSIDRALANGQLKLMKEQILKSASERNKNQYEIKRIESALESENLKRKLMNIEIEVRKMGMNPNDPFWQKILGNVMQQAADAVGLDVNPLLFK